MVERSGDATALLGMDGFVVLTQTEEAGEFWLLVETDRDVVGCPSCGVRAVGNGRSVVQVRDLPIGDRTVRLVWRKRRWRCADPDCASKSFTESSELVEGSITTRAAREICRLVVHAGEVVPGEAGKNLTRSGPAEAAMGTVVIVEVAEPDVGGSALGL